MGQARMEKKYARAFLASLVLLTLNAQAKDVEMAWEKAMVYTPTESSLSKVSELALNGQHPALIYLHGCTGITGHDISWAKLAASRGFLVVMPDSMSRPNRKSNCDPRQRGGTNVFPQAYQYRQQEITYAIDQVQASTWWDKKNIFLMGHSEGGIATAQSTHEVFNGLIISGWTCTHTTNQDFDGIKSPKKIPVIAIASIDDGWRKGKPNEGRCANKADGRFLVQLDLEGKMHDTYHSAVARDAVVKFLSDHLKQ